jgi:hypothetical protein
MKEAQAIKASPLQLRRKSEDAGKIVVSVTAYRNLQRELFAARESIEEMRLIIREKDELINALLVSNLRNDASSEADATKLFDAGSTTDEGSADGNQQEIDDNIEESSSCQHDFAPSWISYPKNRPTRSYAVTKSSHSDECCSQASDHSDLSDDNDDFAEPHRPLESAPLNDLIGIGDDECNITVDVVGETSPLSNSIVERCTAVKRIHRQNNMFPIPRAMLFGFLFVLVCSFQCYSVLLLDADAYIAKRMCSDKQT